MGEKTSRARRIVVEVVVVVVAVVVAVTLTRAWDHRSGGTDRSVSATAGATRPGPTSDAGSPSAAPSASVAAPSATGSPTTQARPGATRKPSPATSPATSPAASPTATPSSSQPLVPTTSAGLRRFPSSRNVGVPARIRLTTYRGPLTITRDNTVIRRKVINGDVIIKASNVLIKSSRINGILRSYDDGSVTVLQSDIDGGDQQEFPAVGDSHITLNRVDVTGGEHSVQCSTYCTILNSYLHDQYLGADSDGHVNAFISNGGNHLVLRHNTVHCTVPLTENDGGCSGDVSLFGDFSPISDVVIDNNYFMANQVSISYCLYAGYNPDKPYGRNPTRVSVTNNVFQRGANNKCGVYGPVTSFIKGFGNVWSNNRWAGSKRQVRSAE